MNPTQEFVAKTSGAAVLLGLLTALPAAATPFTFSTGTVTNDIATGARPGPDSGSNQETESADDFLLNDATRLNSATFTGLIPTDASVSQVIVEIYRVFPKDSDTTRTDPNPPFGTSKVPARQNSPSDVEFLDRNSATSGELSFTTADLPTFTSAKNSVDLGIHPIPGFNTGGDGAVTGLQEVRFDVMFDEPIDLPADHYFFVPQVLLSDPNDHFLWLSASRPIDTTGTPFTPDLQSWIRNHELQPDWLRIGTDIVGGTMFNAAFTLEGETIAAAVPEPASMSLLGAALVGMGAFGWQRRRRRRSAPSA
jgi:PEP-CTERM motif-containing protein